MSTPLRSTVRAGFWIRAVALAIDLIFILLLYLMAWGVLSFSGAIYRPYAADLIFGATILIYTSLEIFCAGSIGKLLLKLRIRRQDSQPADGWMLLLRWSTKQSPWILMVVFSVLPHPVFRLIQGFLELILLCGMFAALNDDHLAWHDQWAGTAVWKVHRMEVTAPSAPIAREQQPIIAG